MEIIILLVVIVFLFMLNSRVRKLEGLINEIPRRGGVGVPQEATQLWQIPQEQGAPSVATSAVGVPVVGHEPAVPREATWDESFGAWIKEDWLLKLGALILLMGFGFFLVVVGMILGPLGRVTLGLLSGAGILLFGWIRMNKFVKQGSIFLVLGSIVIILSAFTATYGYQLFPAELSLIVMLLAAAFVALASVRHRLVQLAITSLVLASFSPALLLSGVVPLYTELFAYLFIVTLGAIWVVVLTGWRVLTLVSVVIFALYSLPHLGGIFGGSSGANLLWYAYAFSVLFFVTNIAGILKGKEGDTKSDLVAAGINGFLLLAWITAAVSLQWKSLVMVAWMLVFVVAAFVVFAITKRREPFFVYAGVGIAMVAAATAIDFNGAGLVIAYTIESGIAAFVAYGITRNRNIAKSLTPLLLGPGVLAFQSILANWSYPNIPFDHFFALLILSGTLILLGVFFWSLPKEEGETSPDKTLFLAGSVYAYILLWLSLHAVMTETAATMLSLTVYAIIGFIAYAYGKRHDQKPVTQYGTVLLTFVAGHLVIFESFRDGNIFIFFIVGAVLVATAFIGKRKNSDTPLA